MKKNLFLAIYISLAWSNLAVAQTSLPARLWGSMGGTTVWSVTNSMGWSPALDPETRYLDAEVGSQPVISSYRSGGPWGAGNRFFGELPELGNLSYHLAMLDTNNPYALLPADGSNVVYDLEGSNSWHYSVVYLPLAYDVDDKYHETGSTNVYEWSATLTPADPRRQPGDPHVTLSNTYHSTLSYYTNNMATNDLDLTQAQVKLVNLVDTVNSVFGVGWDRGQIFESDFFDYYDGGSITNCMAYTNMFSRVLMPSHVSVPMYREYSRQVERALAAIGAKVYPYGSGFEFGPEYYYYINTLALGGVPNAANINAWLGGTDFWDLTKSERFTSPSIYEKITLFEAKKNRFSNSTGYLPLLPYIDFSEWSPLFPEKEQENLYYETVLVPAVAITNHPMAVFYDALNVPYEVRYRRFDSGDVQPYIYYGGEGPYEFGNIDLSSTNAIDLPYIYCNYFAIDRENRDPHATRDLQRIEPFTLTFETFPGKSVGHKTWEYIPEEEKYGWVYNQFVTNREPVYYGPWRDLYVPGATNQTQTAELALVSVSEVDWALDADDVYTGTYTSHYWRLEHVYKEAPDMVYIDEFDELEFYTVDPVTNVLWEKTYYETPANAPTLDLESINFEILEGYSWTNYSTDLVYDLVDELQYMVIPKYPIPGSSWATNKTVEGVGRSTNSLSEAKGASYTNTTLSSGWGDLGMWSEVSANEDGERRWFWDADYFLGGDIWRNYFAYYQPCGWDRADPSLSRYVYTEAVSDSATWIYCTNTYSALVQEVYVYSDSYGGYDVETNYSHHCVSSESDLPEDREVVIPVLPSDLVITKTWTYTVIAAENPQTYEDRHVAEWNDFDLGLAENRYNHFGTAYGGTIQGDNLLTHDYNTGYVYTGASNLEELVTWGALPPYSETRAFSSSPRRKVGWRAGNMMYVYDIVYFPPPDP